MNVDPTYTEPHLAIALRMGFDDKPEHLKSWTTAWLLIQEVPALRPSRLQS